jgi:hypothetical protein
MGFGEAWVASMRGSTGYGEGRMDKYVPNIVSGRGRERCALTGYDQGKGGFVEAAQ